MATLAPLADVAPYRPAVEKWMPHAEIRPGTGPFARFDALLTVRVAGKTVRYLIEEKRHFRHQDAAVIAEQLNRRRAAMPATHAADRILLLAPYIRDRQAELLERAGIEYIDLVGNGHLNPPGLFVHVEGRRPPKEPVTGYARPQKGWVKAVMALLVKPDLANAPYRDLADEADVALGTVAKCMNDLALRGLLLDRDGKRNLTDRPALVALWVPAYIEALRPKLAERRFQVRAGDNDKKQIWAQLRLVLGERGQPWALTGADAAGQRDHYFRAAETEIYAPVRLLEDREVQKALVAQPAAREGNLIVIEPPGPLAIPETATDAVPIAPDLLAYAELRYRGTEQALEAADLLLPRVTGNGAA